jgi:DNA replication protein DnaC
MNERLLSALRELRLSGLAETLDVRLQEAAGHQLSHAEFLELILQDERLVRQERQIARRTKSALFREVKPLEPNHADCGRKHTFYEPPESAYSMC